MTSEADFSVQEWTRLKRGPLVAGWRSRWPIPEGRSSS
jgi:hypothetical protein